MRAGNILLVRAEVYLRVEYLDTGAAETWLRSFTLTVSAPDVGDQVALPGVDGPVVTRRSFDFGEDELLLWVTAGTYETAAAQKRRLLEAGWSRAG